MNTLELLKKQRDDITASLQQATSLFQQAELQSNINLLDKLISELDKIEPKKCPNVELKAQYLKDVETCKSIPTLEPWQLLQVKRENNEWHDILHKPNFQDDVEYRRHPHADNIIKYHQCSERDKKRWQVWDTDEQEWVSVWFDYHTDEPQWFEDQEYRLKPDTITINGKEYNAPLRTEPKNGRAYYYLSLSLTEDCWVNHNVDHARLRDSRCFATEEDTQAVLNAFYEILRGQDGS